MRGLPGVYDAGADAEVVVRVVPGGADRRRVAWKEIGWTLVRVGEKSQVSGMGWVSCKSVAKATEVRILYLPLFR